MTDDGQNRLAKVAAATLPKQAKDTHPQWAWVEQAVWTERMLTRLEQSEPATKWYGLWDKVWAHKNLLHGFYAVMQGEQVDKQTLNSLEHRSNGN
jgi:hypothetical protein